MRIEQDVTRGAAIEISVDGIALAAFDGETIATAMLSQGMAMFRRDARGRPRGLFCNMGTCGECMVTLTAENRRVRACVTDAQNGMDIATDG
ncbi:(2Fe-2S)-binding protein [Sphingobium boeckii]|uniref:Sarcosine oxidase subunit alpha n=1 Tax=Sphingobium boeckii TaxID=1082345 RepID=A0A7W9AJJ4_9SPHN|nr:(2Fe-2S)-binding protein [Sphingobium boeckii]MBB5686864.1 sarcosine oxidase subunit alpha [Sphingobium boeckii]